MAAPFGVRPLARSSVVGGAGAAAQLPPAQPPTGQPPTAQLQGMVLPGGPWRAAGAHSAVVRATGRPPYLTASTSQRGRHRCSTGPPLPIPFCVHVATGELPL